VHRALIAFLVLASAVADAYPNGAQFDLDPVTDDGAGGVPFTGSPRIAGRDCSACHIDPPRTIGVSIQSNDLSLLQEGYGPGKQYRLRVSLTNEHAGALFRTNGDMCGTRFTPYVPCDDNGFALEIDDVTGKTVGKLQAYASGACTDSPPLDADAYVLMDGSAVASTGVHHGQVGWDFCWTAPNPAVGPLYAYVGVVDGNGGDGTAANPNDIYGDDVFVGTLPISQRGVSAGPQTGGCSVALSGSGGGVLVVVGLLVLMSLRWRRLLALLLLVASCATVKPWQKETLAKKIMQLAPDSNEDELDIHMHEAREGSAGAQGSGGGGCGCN
jgi:hypothetical protein